MRWSDEISELPESLLIQILSYLPTKDSVKTSVLSTRWKNLCLNVPVLDLNCHDFPFEDHHVFINFIDRYLEINQESRLHKFKVNYSSDVDIYRFSDRVATAINHGIQYLDLVSNIYYRDKSDSLIYPCIEFMPLNLYTSKTLVSLKLSNSGLEDPGFVSLPCLKFIELRKIQWYDPMNLEKLISGCPVLEELIFLRDIHDDLAVTRLRSQSLKRFSVPLEDEIFFEPKFEYTLEIDAPGLEYMSLKEDHFDRYVVKNLNSLSMIELDIKCHVKFGMFSGFENLSKRNQSLDFLTGISNVRHMIISQPIVKAFILYLIRIPIPKFNNLSSLQAAFPSTLLKFLPTLLDKCPNLKHLILNIIKAKKMEKLRLINVPRCMLSTLECVEIKGIYEWEKDEKTVVSYFVEKSAVLKKLILSFIGGPATDIHEELNKLTKRSSRCRLIVHDF